jgi:hypothetical protein
MIKVVGKTLRRVKDAGRALPRVEPATVAAALGAERVAKASVGPQGPLALFALRQSLTARLRSTGGRPGLGDLRRQKIPLSDSDWETLVTLADAVADDEIHPTPGQIASELLRRQLAELRDQLRSDDVGSAPVVKVVESIAASSSRPRAAAARSAKAARSSSR